MRESVSMKIIITIIIPSLYPAVLQALELLVYNFSSEKC